MILVCYDGSADSQAAIDHAAQLMAGAEATVLTIWEPFLDRMIRGGAMGMGMAMGSTAPSPTMSRSTPPSSRRLW